MSIKVLIEDFEIDDFNKLSALFGSYFQKTDKLLSKEYTEWLYQKNSCGVAKMVKAIDGDSWVGFMAMIPVNLVRHDAKLVGYYVVNVLVHPQHHGKHIFSRLITAAKEFVKQENAVLMGHPNDMALMFWKRGRMDFHGSLVAGFVIPTLFSKGSSARDIKDAVELKLILPKLQAQAQQSERWSIDMTLEYINWRYLQHPVQKYRLQLINVNNDAVGFVVSKRLRFGVNLLIDQLILDSHGSDGFRQLPWFTISFKPELSTRELKNSLWFLPVKKTIPFFFTHYSHSFTDNEVMNLGLSASDF